MNVDQPPRIGESILLDDVGYDVMEVYWRYPFTHTAEAIVYVRPFA